MRFIAILFFFAIIPGQSQCQVVLNASDYPSVLTGVDTLRITTVASLFPAFSTSTPGMWDMTLSSDSSAILSKVYSGVSSSFGVDGVWMVGNYQTQATHKFSLGSSKIELVNEQLPSATFDLFPVTSGGADTFYILGQTSLYSTPINEIVFPGTSTSSWNSTGYVDVAFELSVATYFYLHEPGYLRTYTERNNVVTNWGKMRVRDAAGAPSAYIDVLQVRTTTITTDSAFLSGGPMPGHIQLLLGITQGKKDTVYSQSYYRKGEVTPLAYVEFSDETFSHALRAKTHVQRLSTSVSAIERAHEPFVFPNPATDYVTFDNATGTYCNYRVSDVSGSILQTGIVDKRGEMRVLLNAQLSNGLYWLHLTTNSGETSVAGFVISK